MARRRVIAGLVAGVGSAALIAGMSGIPAVAGDLPHERLAGPSGVETSLAVAKHTWGTDWKVVYVASNRNPVDALPAATIGDGPVVLTDGKTLNLGGVKPGKIVILGGTGAVSQGIEDQAKATGAEVIRLKGSDRNATAGEIAKQWVKINGSPKNVYVTKNVGSGSPDAVAASVLRDGPILTFTNDASAAALAGTVAELKAPKVTALGGTGVVPDAVVNAAANGKATARLAGANRFETAFEIAKYAKGQKSGSNVYLASGTALKDAMVAGAAKDGVILLSPANGAGVKAKADTLGATKLIVIGGTKALPDVTVTAAATGVIPKPQISAKDMTWEEAKQLPIEQNKGKKSIYVTDQRDFLIDGKYGEVSYTKTAELSVKKHYERFGNAAVLDKYAAGCINQVSNEYSVAGFNVENLLGEWLEATGRPINTGMNPETLNAAVPIPSDTLLLVNPIGEYGESSRYTDDVSSGFTAVASGPYLFVVNSKGSVKLFIVEVDDDTEVAYLRGKNDLEEFVNRGELKYTLSLYDGEIHFQNPSDPAYYNYNFRCNDGPLVSSGR